MRKILLTNDDGFLSKGLLILKDQLKDEFKITTVAPTLEQSAVSMSLTLNNPLKVKKIEDDFYMVNGTPADCVNVGIQKLMEGEPDIIVSGMNMGENLSEDIFFSGTCGGAFAGHLYNLPALAVSLISDKKSYSHGEFNLENSLKITRKVIHMLLGFDNNQYVFNLNIPHDADGTIRITKLGYKRYKPNIIERLDPRGNQYFWIGTGNPEYQGDINTDVGAVNHKISSLTLLKYDLNFQEEYLRLKKHFNEKT